MSLRGVPSALLAENSTGFSAKPPWRLETGLGRFSTTKPGLECHSLSSSFLAFIQYQAEKYLFVFVLHGFQVSKLNILYLYFMQKEYY